jgi:Na+/proline symporter
MLPTSRIIKVTAQVFGVAFYFVLVAVLYWLRLTDAGAAAIIVGLLFLFKTAVDSRAISTAHLSPSDPESTIRSPAIELLKAFSFLGVGLGALIDLSRALETGLVPQSLPAAVIHIVLVCVFAICVVSCFARFTVPLNNRLR